MGYYTNYTLTWESDDKVTDWEIEDYIENLDPDSDDGYGIYAAYHDGCNDMKWYEWQEHMVKFSMEFPEVLFKLEGKGEEHGDLWVAYIKNGKVQLCKAKITFDDFDESKLV